MICHGHSLIAFASELQEEHNNTYMLAAVLIFTSSNILFDKSNIILWNNNLACMDARNW